VTGCRRPGNDAPGRYAVRHTQSLKTGHGRVRFAHEEAGGARPLHQAHASLTKVKTAAARTSEGSAMATYSFLQRRVAQYMTPAPRTVPPTLTLGALDALFAQHRFNAFPVEEEGRLVGYVTQLDFLKAFGFSTKSLVPHYDELMMTEIRRVMSASVVTVEADAPLTRVLQLLLEMRARSFPVVDEAGKLVGIIAREDLMRALRESAKEAA